MRSQREVAAVPIPVETLARSIARHPDYRVQRRSVDLDRREPRLRKTGELSVAVIDCETTGTDPTKDRIIELAVQRIAVDGRGAIVETGPMRSWLEDPGMPISAEISRITGITDADVRGLRIADGEAYSMIATADIRLAHNAAFDRPFVDQRLELGGEAWICSLNDMDWTAHGFECRKLGCVLGRCGGFHDAHRAAGDVSALVNILDHRLPGGSTVMRELIRGAARPTYLVEAPKTPFAATQELRGRGYRWDDRRKLRWRYVGEEAIDAEVEWLINDVYAGKREPVVERVTWRERYSLRE